MAAMGWKPGQGLGPDGEGRANPVEPGRPRPLRQGLGLGRSRAVPVDGSIEEKLMGIELDGEIVFGYA